LHPENCPVWQDFYVMDSAPSQFTTARRPVWRGLYFAVRGWEICLADSRADPPVRARTAAEPPPRLLYVTAEDWAFLSHRLPMARAARDAGFDVHVATRVQNGRAAIEAEGF